MEWMYAAGVVALLIAHGWTEWQRRFHRNNATDMMFRLVVSVSESTVMRDSLDFYADPGAWVRPAEDEVSAAALDQGHSARTALSIVGKIDNGMKEVEEGANDE